MRPIVVKGHERPLTQLKFNSDGDLFFSAGRDKNVCVWYSSNGERLGTLGPHAGAVFSIDVDKDCRAAITGASDLLLRVFDVKSGQEKLQIDYKSTPRFVELSPDNKQLLVVAEEQMGQKGSIVLYDVDLSDIENPKLTETAHYVHKSTPFVKASWSYDGKHIIAAHRGGTVSKINAKTGDTEVENKIHEDRITDLQMSPDRTYFVTSSRDKNSHLCYVDDLKIQKSYPGDVPLNSAAITPIKNFIIAGGGMDARDVTTSSDGKFETHFFHKIYEDDLGRLGGHFGPINTIAVHPHGTCYVSGSEDGYVRLLHFDPSYFEFDYGKPDPALA